MEHILVTGGAGFVGSHLTASLLSRGHKVTVLDDLSTGSRQNLPEHPQLNLVEQDVCHPWKGEVQRIYHLACAASPPHYQRDPLQTLRTNFIGTQNVLELARECGARVLLTSTSEVYGDPHVSPQAESYWGNVNSFGPRSCYDEGKRVAESLCYSYATVHGVCCRVARIFNTYGPNMDPEDGRVVSNFIVQALKGLPLTVYGDGSQTRSLCYVDDLVDGLIRLMHLQGNALEHPVNLGNPHELTVRQIAEKILKLVGSASTIEQHPLPKDDPKQRRPDISRATELLGWTPKVGVDEGLTQTARYFKERVLSSTPG